jgi:hypothetical protein
MGTNKTLTKISDGAKAVWNFLDGKKTVIGTGLLLASEALPKSSTAYYICYVGGTLLGGVGLLHKADKTNAARVAIDGIKKIIRK